MNAVQLASLIDHTALKPEATRDHIVQLCTEAIEFRFAAVCVAPAWVEVVQATLSNSPIKIASVIGFPHGNTLTGVKAFEARQAIERGAHELDMVIPVGALKSGDRNAVLHDIRSVVEAARERHGTLVKVILETALLTDSEKVLACELSELAGADFVKTSTGFADGGATLQDVALLRRTVGNRLGVKAAGGIKNLSTARAMVEAGASRLGCSSSVLIMKEFLAETAKS